MTKTVAIAERTQAGCPMLMVMDADRMISIQSKKTGRRYDTGHNLDEFYEANPLIAQEIFNRRGEIYSPMTQELQAFVEDMWLMAEELDPWYINEPIVEDKPN